MADVAEEEKYLYRISTAQEWDWLQTKGSTLGGELDKTTGCIHLSKLNQVEWVLGKFFVNSNKANKANKAKVDEDLYLLEIEAEKLGEGLVYEGVVEEGDESKVFPHFYGPLALEAVRKAEKLVPLVQEEDGAKFSCSLLTQRTSNSDL